MTDRAGIIVMAKAPVAGRVKTRLCPPFTPAQAASLAEAMLADTLAAVMATPAPWRVVALEGQPGPWLPYGLPVVAQRGATFDERLACAFTDIGAPGLLIGADTPQAGPDLLDQALRALCRPGVDAVIGPAPDGGYWALGLRRPDERVFLGVHMSEACTFAGQRARLADLELATVEVETLRDVDTLDDAIAVAAEAPASRFAAVLGQELAAVGCGPR
ncbi:MAG: TIGR04282 family arsenosugar biosynthesis glycosyltransferase [Acidimicrobiales bacterium]